MRRDEMVYDEALGPDSEIWSILNIMSDIQPEMEFDIRPVIWKPDIRSIHNWNVSRSCLKRLARRRAGRRRLTMMTCTPGTMLPCHSVESLLRLRFNRIRIPSWTFKKSGSHSPIRPMELVRPHFFFSIYSLVPDPMVLRPDPTIQKKKYLNPIRFLKSIKLYKKLSRQGSGKTC